MWAFDFLLVSHWLLWLFIESNNCLQSLVFGSAKLAGWGLLYILVHEEIVHCLKWFSFELLGHGNKCFCEPRWFTGVLHPVLPQRYFKAAIKCHLLSESLYLLGRFKNLNIGRYWIWMMRWQHNDNIWIFLLSQWWSFGKLQQLAEPIPKTRREMGWILRM